MEVRDGSPWVPPSAFAEYRLIRPIGAGAMGRVYLYHDTGLDRQVAVKFIAQREPDVQARERFFVEARAVARLQHPNVVSVYRIGEWDGHPYLVSEFVAGTSLDASERPWPLERIPRFALGLAQGLSAAHRRGVLHRDIKPANIMVGAHLEPKLLDFGLAKLLDAEGDVAPGDRPDAARPEGPAPASLTRTGATLGTPLYLAPELWGGAVATARSDVYALGAVLFELCAGWPPLHGLTIDEMRRSAMEQDAPPIAACAADVEPRLAALIDRCLRRDPAERFASAVELEEALAGLLVPAPAAIPSTRGAAQSARGHGGAARRLLFAGAAALLLGGVLAGLHVRLSKQRVAASSPPATGSEAEDRPRMVDIPAGTFLMGSPEDEPGRDADEVQHQVHISRPFLLSETEVTRGQYARVLRDEASSGEDAALPATKVSWFDAVEYCNALSRREGLEECYSVIGGEVGWPSGLGCRGYRLPTEAEWEYAARAGQPFMLAGANRADDVGWYAANAQERLQPVRRKKANAWGLYDMSGDVWEWVWDWYENYPKTEAADPTGPRLGAQRLNRGGSWIDDPRFLRVADRSRNGPDTRLIILGFRVARTR